MAEVHEHRGAPHPPGPSNCLGYKGNVISCGPDPQEPYSGNHVCTHVFVWKVEDDGTTTGTTGGTGTGGASTAGGSGGATTKKGPFGLPDSSFSKWSDGHTDGNTTIYFRQSVAYGITPFFSTTVPCNPDAPGQVTVTESTTETVRATATVGSGAKAAIQSSLGVEIGVSKTITISQVFNGERCRTFRLDIYVKYCAYEILYVTPTASGVIGVLVPIGTEPVKTPVPPACCSATTAGMMKSVRDKSVNETGVAKHALARSENHLAWAKGHLDASADYQQVLEGYRRAVESMILSGRNGVDCLDQIALILAVADELAAAVLRDSRDPILVPDDRPNVPRALVEAAIGHELLALAREYRASHPGRAIGWYCMAYDYGDRAVRLQRDSRGVIREADDADKPHEEK
jgi:hypothetical protein